MANVKFSPRLPDGDGNGLGPIVQKLIDEPNRKHVVIMVVDNRATVTDNDTGSVLPTVRIRRVETVLPDDLAVAERLVRRALEFRTGDSVLPMELEDEITMIFRDLDMDKPEPSAGGELEGQMPFPETDDDAEE